MRQCSHRDVAHTHSSMDQCLEDRNRVCIVPCAQRFKIELVVGTLEHVSMTTALATNTASTPRIVEFFEWKGSKTKRPTETSWTPKALALSLFDTKSHRKLSYATDFKSPRELLASWQFELSLRLWTIQTVVSPKMVPKSSSPRLPSWLNLIHNKIRMPKGCYAIFLEMMKPDDGHANFTMERSHPFPFLCIASNGHHGNSPKMSSLQCVVRRLVRSLKTTKLPNIKATIYFIYKQRGHLLLVQQAIPNFRSFQYP